MKMLNLFLIIKKLNLRLISENEKKLIELFLQRIDKVSDSNVEKIKLLLMKLFRKKN